MTYSNANRIYWEPLFLGQMKFTRVSKDSRQGFWSNILMVICESEWLFSFRSAEQSSPKLYFVKVDVQACFDTIEQSTLLDILKHLVSEVGTHCFLYCLSICIWL